ncbi:unnamed protein product [Owenia fusiformis]|uniref:ferroxidase n=1 Tax=Owenia fusiformis TaxID=6347 RepID=A0A8S4PHM0_OWEFU|nr:unnamed protein product [Owenia fusiformis]
MVVTSNVTVFIVVLCFAGYVAQDAKKKRKDVIKCYDCDGLTGLLSPCYNKKRCDKSEYFCGITYQFTPSEGIRVKQGCSSKSKCPSVLDEIACQGVPKAQCKLCCDKNLCNKPDLDIGITTPVQPSTPVPNTTPAPTTTQRFKSTFAPVSQCAVVLQVPTTDLIGHLYEAWYTYYSMAVAFNQWYVALPAASKYFAVSSFVGKMNDIIKLRTIQNMYNIPQKYPRIKPPNLQWGSLLEALETALRIELGVADSYQILAQASEACAAATVSQSVQENLSVSNTVIKELAGLITSLARVGGPRGDYLLDRVVLNHPNFTQVYAATAPKTQFLTSLGNKEALVWLPKQAISMIQPGYSY